MFLVRAVTDQMYKENRTQQIFILKEDVIEWPIQQAYNKSNKCLLPQLFFVSGANFPSWMKPLTFFSAKWEQNRLVDFQSSFRDKLNIE